MSEVAKLRRQIEVECEAIKRAMEGFKVTASHDIINNQFNTIGDIQVQLAALVGERQAALIAVETYIRLIG